MDNKVLVGELVDYYYKLEDAQMVAVFSGDIESTIVITDLLNDMDRILTNVSKRWAKGKKTPKAPEVRIEKHVDGYCLVRNSGSVVTEGKPHMKNTVYRTTEAGIEDFAVQSGFVLQWGDDIKKTM